MPTGWRVRAFVLMSNHDHLRRLRWLGLQREELAGLKKWDAPKAAIAALIRQRTTVTTAWIARELALGNAAK